MGCRLVLILDDLLWVLTDDQLKAALHYADSLTGLLKRATEETQKVKGARKLQVTLVCKYEKSFRKSPCPVFSKNNVEMCVEKTN